MPIFGIKESEGKKLLNHCSIINYGKELSNGMIEFITNKGRQFQKKEHFESSIKLVKFDEICLNNLMDKWKRLNNDYKEVVLDETIDTNEVYEDKFSHLSIMVERRKDCIAIKPIFNL